MWLCEDFESVRSTKLILGGARQCSTTKCLGTNSSLVSGMYPIVHMILTSGVAVEDTPRPQTLRDSGLVR